MKIYENDHFVFTLSDDRNDLELLWKADTAGMSAADFKASLYLYACFATEHKVTNLVVDIHQFNFEGAMSDELTEWRNEQIFPKYSAAGVKKMAFVGEAEQLPPADPPRHPNANFDTRFFSNTDEMNGWLKG